MSHSRITPEQFEALLDARPGSHAAAELQAHIEREPALARDAEIQNAINQSLNRKIQVPAPDAVLAAVKAAIAAQKPASPPQQRTITALVRPLFAVAACIALLLFAAYRLSESGILSGSPRDQIVGGNKRPVAKFDGPSVIAAHETLLAAGYRPSHTVTDPRAIAASVWRRTGQGLIPTGGMPASTRILGLCEVNCLSPQTLALMMQVDGKPLTVLIDKLENDRFICVERPMEITPFRQQIGALVLYEVTPHGRPIVREFFSDPQQTRDWYETGGGF